MHVRDRQKRIPDSAEMKTSTGEMTVRCETVAERPVGCDVEQNAPVRDGAFCRLWVRKESYAKALGRGLSLDFRTFSALRRSGAVHEVPRENVLRRTGGTTYVGIPVYDSPCLLTERGAVELCF